MPRIGKLSLALIAFLSLCSCDERSSPSVYVEGGSRRDQEKLEEAWEDSISCLKSVKRCLESNRVSTDEHFRMGDEMTKMVVINNLEIIQHMMESGECSITVYSQSFEPGSGAVLAYTYRNSERRVIYFNNETFKRHDYNTVRILVHEVAHIAINALDHGYYNPDTSRYFLGERQNVVLTTTDLLTNADTYAMFVADITKKISPQPQ